METFLIKLFFWSFLKRLDLVAWPSVACVGHPVILSVGFPEGTRLIEAAEKIPKWTLLIVVFGNLFSLIVSCWLANAAWIIESFLTVDTLNKNEKQM